MNRRDFLRVGVAAPVMLTGTALARIPHEIMLSPLIEMLAPTQDVPQGVPGDVPPSTYTPTVSGVLEQVMRQVDYWEPRFPGLRRLVTERLVAHETHGLTLTELLKVAERRWPWRETQAMDGWTQHAQAVSLSE